MKSKLIPSWRNQNHSIFPGKRTSRRRACFSVMSLLLLLMSTSLHAALLSHDSFAYPLSAALPGQNGGEGFGGPWVAGVNAGVPASRFQMFTPSLSYPGVASDGARLRVTSGAAQGARRLMSQPMGADGTVRYVSILVRPDATPSASSYFGLQLLGSAGADLFAGKPGGGATQRYVLENAGGAGQVATTRDVTANVVALLVLRLEFNAGNDRVSLYVNPVPGALEPVVADAVKTDLNLGTTVMPALTGPAAWSADELRVGDTFASVLPPGPDFQLRPIQSGSATEHTVVTRQVQTVDPLPAGRTLAFELVGETYGAQIDPVTGEFSWVPGELEGGLRRTFTVRATSNANPPASVTISFFLDVTEGNFPPQLAEIPNQSVREGSEFTYQLVATDADVPLQNIFYSLQVKPEGLNVSSAGVLTWRPTIAQGGRSYPVTVSAHDTMSGRAERSFTLTVQPRTGFTARWKGTADGDWNNPANWDIGRVPNDNATEYFDVLWEQHPVTVRVTGDITIRSFSLSSGGTLDLQSPTGNFSIQSSLFWTGGTLAGQGRMNVRGRANLASAGADSALTLRDQCRLVFNGPSELGTTLRCDGNVSLVVEPAAFLGVPQHGGFLRVNGVPELINEGTLRIWGQAQPIPFILLRNRGSVTTFASTLNFDTGAPIDLIQEPGGRLSLGAGLDQLGTLNGNALFQHGSSVFGQGYIKRARVEGRIQGRLSFDQLSFGATAISKFSLIAPRDLLSATQPVALDGQLELAALQGTTPGPDEAFHIVTSAGEISGGFAGRTFGGRVEIPGRGETMLLARSANFRSVLLSRFLPEPIGLNSVPLNFRLPEVAGGLGGCFVVPHPSVTIGGAIFGESSLTVEITDGYDAAVDRLEFRPNPAFPEADEITFEELAGGTQRAWFRGTNFGTVQLSGGLMTCVLNEAADSEAAVALLGRLRYENTELTADWFTRPDTNYPLRAIVVTRTDASGANEVIRTVDFPVLWSMRIQGTSPYHNFNGSILLPQARETRLHLQGEFSNGQVLYVPRLESTWQQSAHCGVLRPPGPLPGQRSVVGGPTPYCCSVSATSGRLWAVVDLFEGQRELLPPSLLYERVAEFFGCGVNAAIFYVYVTPDCYTTPTGFNAPSGFNTPSDSGIGPNSIVVFYALEALMKGTAAGQQWTDIYRQHGVEVVQLFFEHPSLLAQAKELLATFRPGVVALLAGRGDTVPIYAPMITRVNDFWNALAEHASPALRAALQQEQARFDNFRLFQDRTFNDWAGLLGIRVPFQPYLHISLMQREAAKFYLALNDVPGVDLSLWRSVDLLTWTQVANAEIQRDGSTLIFTDPAPPAGQAFYSVRQ